MAADGSMAGKTVLVTGGTGGIGYATAAGLVRLGARVGIVGRDPSHAEQAARELRQIDSAAEVDVFTVDLSSQAEVRRLADEALATYPRLDVLVNNVGGFWAHRHETVDGLEYTFALNHLAPFLLTRLLLPRLTESGQARVVTVSAGAQVIGRIDFDDLQGRNGYSSQRAFNQSKLANVLFTYELARRTAGTGVTANVLHPGLTDTNFGQEDMLLWMRLTRPLARPFMKSPEQGAQTSIYLASSPEVEGVTGRYFVGRRSKRSAARSLDEQVASRLWSVSAHLTRAPSPEPP